MEKMSIVVPCYNEEESLPNFYKAICQVSEEMKDLEFEFVFVDDGSRDKSAQICEKYVEMLWHFERKISKSYI